MHPLDSLPNAVWPAPLPRVAMLLLMLFLAAGGAYALLTPYLRSKSPELWKEVGLRIAAWLGIALGIVVALSLGRTAWMVAVGLIGVLVYREYARAVGLWSDRAFMAIGYLFIVLVHVVAWWPYPDAFDGPGWWGLYLVMPVWGIVFVLLVPIVRDQYDGMLQKLALSILGMTYFGYFWSHYAYLLNLGHGGVSLVLFLGFLVATNDIAAFVWGKSLGRTRLRPALSPGKTVEGTVGALATVLLVSFGLWWLVPFFSPGHLLALTLLVGVGAVAGDLATSVIKRDLGIKDWSSALPGHGGVLDRANSLVFTAPVFLHYTVYFYGL